MLIQEVVLNTIVSSAAVTSLRENLGLYWDPAKRQNRGGVEFKVTVTSTQHNTEQERAGVLVFLGF